MNAQIENMDIPAHGTEIDPIIPTNGESCQQVSYSQRRLHGKTSWRGSFNLENRRWSCSLCDFQGEVQVKNQIGNIRHQHMSTCHPKDMQISIGIGLLLAREISWVEEELRTFVLVTRKRLKNFKD